MKNSVNDMKMLTFCKSLEQCPISSLSPGGDLCRDKITVREVVFHMLARTDSPGEGAPSLWCVIGVGELQGLGRHR